MSSFDDPVALLVPLLGTIMHPVIATTAILLSFLAHSRWTVRGGTAAAGGLIGLIDALDAPGILVGLFVVGSSALGGLLVAEAVLVILAPILALLFGLAAVILARLRALR
ncbi:hypothetical protein EDC65_4771 [Stella humosa]|uniref:Uncharacterized protein n=1 Tax=Stella humosa TaxID=94 RepID=A0A3N1KY52_9PROT|nr:hypothetical protein [Stella humosa]ROP83238.1 hypothetical protein EDC65_4771 [Stella humosa]BBK29980.1 hypothetical protein STHU_06140 [Stella humosa]